MTAFWWTCQVSLKSVDSWENFKFDGAYTKGKAASFRGQWLNSHKKKKFLLSDFQYKNLSWNHVISTYETLDFPTK